MIVVVWIAGVVVGIRVLPSLASVTQTNDVRFLSATFFVRTLLAPSVAVLLGRWNWWPSRLSRRRTSMVTAEPPHVPHSADPLGRPDHPGAVESGVPAAGYGQSGVDGNERLTGLAGAILLVLFAVEIITVVPLRSLISVHFFVGVLLVGPVAVKTASTGWRFARYYTRHPAYRRKGAPRLLLRVLAPLLVVTTLAVLGSGIALAATGPAPLILLQIHLLSFLVWLLVVIVHVAAYLPRMLTLITEDWRRHPTQPTAREAPRPADSGRRARWMVNAAALVAAAIAALLLLPTAAPWVGWFTQSVAGPGVVAVLVITLAVVVATVRHLVRVLSGHPNRRPPDRSGQEEQ